jgi:hypothetical protein
MSGTASPVGPDIQDAMHPGYVSGRYYGFQPTLTLVGTAVTAGTIYFCPIPIYRRVRVSSLAVIPQTAVAGVTGKLALYGNSPSRGLPSTLIAACSGTVDMNTTANTTVAAAFTSVQTLNPGWYWGASVFSGAAQPYNFGANSATAQGIGWAIGANSLRSIVGTGATTQSAGITCLSAYASDFPAIPAASHTTNNPGSVYVGFLVA